jgi:hypothetical protein
VNARRTLRWIKAQKKGQVSLRDVRRDALGQSLNGTETRELLDSLVTAGWLRSFSKSAGPDGGKRIHRWDVNPLLWRDAETAVTAVTGLDEVEDDKDWQDTPAIREKVY